MRRLLTVVSLCSFILFPPADSQAAACSTVDCPGQPCTELGVSKLSDDQANIIFCGKNLTNSTPAFYWKSTVSDIHCPSGQVVTSIINGIATCSTVTTALNISPCVAEYGQALAGVVSGRTICSGPVTYTLSAWSDCSKTCGGGTRTRKCLGSDGSSANSKSRCGGSALSQTCNTQACPAGGTTTTPSATSCATAPTAGCSGQSCDELGATKMSDDKANIIACLKNTSGSTPALVWKSTISDLACPAGQMVSVIKNGVPVCVALSSQMLLNVTPCNYGDMLVGIENGQPVCEYEP